MCIQSRIFNTFFSIKTDSGNFYKYTKFTYDASKFQMIREIYEDIYL